MLCEIEGKVTLRRGPNGKTSPSDHREVCELGRDIAWMSGKGRTADGSLDRKNGFAMQGKLAAAVSGDLLSVQND